MYDSTTSQEVRYLESDDENNISLSDLLWFCASRWRVVLVLMLVGAVIANTLGYLSRRSEAALTDQDVVDQFLSDAESDGTYSEEDIKGLNDLASTLVSYYKTYRKQQTYNDESIIQNIDWTNVVSVTAYYRVYCGDSSSSGDLFAVSDTIVNRLNSNELYLAAGDALGMEAKYVQELVSAGATMAVPSDSDTTSATTNETISILLQDEPDTAIVYITAKGENEQFCQTILDCAGDIIQAMLEEGDLSQLTGDVEVSFIQNQQSTGIDTTIRDTQAKITSAKTTYETAKENLLQDLSSAESTYVEAKASVKEQELGLIAESESSEVGYISKLYIAIGLFVGLIIGLSVYGLRYIYSDRMQEPLMPEGGTSMREYVVENAETSVRGIDAFIRSRRYAAYRILKPGQVVALIAAEILASKHMRIKKVLITGTAYTEQETRIVAGMTNELARSGIQVVSAEQFMYNPAAIEEARDAEVAIVLEGIARSKKAVVDEELAYLTSHGLPVVAAVIELA